MPASNYWIKPNPFPTQPATNADHGYIEYPHLDIERVYWDFLTVDAARQLRGIRYLDPEIGRAHV